MQRRAFVSLQENWTAGEELHGLDIGTLEDLSKHSCPFRLDLKLGM